jgi:hypothetical protein
VVTAGPMKVAAWWWWRWADAEAAPTKHSFGYPVDDGWLQGWGETRIRKDRVERMMADREERHGSGRLGWWRRTRGAGVKRAGEGAGARLRRRKWSWAHSPRLMAAGGIIDHEWRRKILAANQGSLPFRATSLWETPKATSKAKTYCHVRCNAAHGRPWNFPVMFFPPEEDIRQVRIHKMQWILGISHQIDDWVCHNQGCKLYIE